MEKISSYGMILYDYIQAENNGDFSALNFSSEIVNQLTPEELLLITDKYPKQTCPLIRACSKEQRIFLREEMSRRSSPLNNF